MGSFFSKNTGMETRAISGNNGIASKGVSDNIGMATRAISGNNGIASKGVSDNLGMAPRAISGNIGMAPGAMNINISNLGTTVIAVLLAICQFNNHDIVFSYLLSTLRCCFLISISLVAVLLVFVLNNGAASKSSTEDKPKLCPGTTLLVVGNPGVGKSSLLNGFIGKNMFEAGLHTHSLTTESKIMEDHSDRNTFIDTPGFDDCIKEGKEEAAKKIVEAFKQVFEEKEHELKLVFVVTVDALRVRNCDLKALEYILEVFGTKSVPYAIIVNKVTDGEFAAIRGSESVYKEFLNILNGDRNNKTAFVAFNDYQTDLTGNDSRNIPSIADDVFHCINTLPSFKVQVNDIHKLDVTEYNKKDLEEQKKEFKKKYNEEVRKLKESIEKILRNNPGKVMESREVDVGPIWGNHEASVKVNRFLNSPTNKKWKKEGWKWNGHWVTKPENWGKTSHAMLVRMT